MPKVLLVQDVPVARETRARILSRLATVLTAGSGEEAVRLARAERPDLILLDLEPGGRSGLQACRVIRSDPAVRVLPAVAATEEGQEEEARGAGVEHFIRRAADPDQFLTEVRRVLALVGEAEPRVPADAPLQFWHEGRPGDGRLTDLSRTGLFAATLELPPVGARLEVSFSLPHDFSGRKVSGEVIVVRRTEAVIQGFGSRFFSLPLSGRRLVDEFLGRLGSRPSRPS